MGTLEEIFGLRGRVALVTGASSGLGAEAAEALAGAGADVALVARRAERLEAVAPAYFPTEMTVDPARGEVSPEQAESMRRFTPLGRLGRAGELRSAILFLTAPGSSYVTGSVVAVDGGWTAW